MMMSSSFLKLKADKIKISLQKKLNLKKEVGILLC